ncbi:alpha/beta hydrolase [Boudabousia marimammalium]|uniref:Serine aminopeptidase S33 domain-containing protein n=1 Tax=Boudabousia marimammalium TaxID=156892 RepID=A0A1Q5PMJ6_9ACTO|nr:alpha/beta hydrolase [Boudabousia marimammalium]OKL48752.1 hypothetical protein BM477_06055 [Boudabousia marimammalium]
MYLYGTVKAAEKPIGVVLLVHGYAEHSGRYRELIEELNQHDLTVVTYDHASHGLSEGPRAQVDVNDLLRQHYRVRKQVREMFPNLPLFLLGHSMGGLITAASVLTQPDDIAGVVLSGPALGLRPSLPIPVTEALYQLGKWLPSLPMSPFDEDGISYDRANVQDYLDDPLNYVGSVPLLTGSSMANLGLRLRDKFAKWTPDALVLQGADDDIVDIQIVRKFAAEAGTAHDVRPVIDYVEIPDSRHELYREAQGPVFNTLTAQWIQQRC